MLTIRRVWTRKKVDDGPSLYYYIALIQSISRFQLRIAVTTDTLPPALVWQHTIVSSFRTSAQSDLLAPHDNAEPGLDRCLLRNEQFRYPLLIAVTTNQHPLWVALACARLLVAALLTYP